MNLTYFQNAVAFRAWLERHHASVTELWLGFYRKDSGRKGITYPEALDEALCFGWIDGVRKKVDAVSYTNRFTPRKSRSTWSLVNTRRAEELKRLGRMAAAGLKAFEARQEDRTGIYSFENPASELPAASERKFRARPRAWKHFLAQPPGYRRVALWWVMSAKREETRERRLARLIKDSAHGRRLGILPGPPATRQAGFADSPASNRPAQNDPAR